MVLDADHPEREATYALRECRICMERRLVFLPFVIDPDSQSNALPLSPLDSSTEGELIVQSKPCQYHRATGRALGARADRWTRMHVTLEPNALLGTAAGEAIATIKKTVPWGGLG